METIKKFEIGKKYYAKSICDQECVWNFEVVKRTKCFIWIKEEGKSEILRRKVYEWNGAEACSPLGKYSMSPTLNAERFVEESEQQEEVVNNEEIVNIEHADDYYETSKPSSKEVTTSGTIIIEAISGEEDTVDGNSYHFSKNNIDYGIFIKNDNITVWRTNNQRGGQVSCDCYWNGVTNDGKKMPKVIIDAVGLIATNFQQYSNIGSC